MLVTVIVSPSNSAVAKDLTAALFTPLAGITSTIRLNKFFALRLVVSFFDTVAIMLVVF